MNETLGVIEALKAKTRECFDTANRSLSRNYPYPEIEFNLRGTAAGWAYSGLNRIRFNLGLARDNLQVFLDRTVVHECGHIIANKYFNMNCGHGPKWKWIMQTVFRADPTRCHNYDVSAHRVRRRLRYLYKCSCCNGNILIKLNHHRIVQNSSMYSQVHVKHRACGAVISKYNYRRQIDIDNKEEMQYIGR